MAKGRRTLYFIQSTIRTSIFFAFWCRAAMGRRPSVGCADSDAREMGTPSRTSGILMDLVYVLSFLFNIQSVAIRTTRQRFAPPFDTEQV